MTNPRFVRFLSELQAQGIEALPQAIVRLNQMARFDPSLADIAETLRQSFAGSDQGGEAQR